MLLGGANIGYGDLLSYLDACNMPFVFDARLAVLLSGAVVVCVFFCSKKHTHTTTAPDNSTARRASKTKGIIQASKYDRRSPYPILAPPRNKKKQI